MHSKTGCMLSKISKYRQMILPSSNPSLQQTGWPRIQQMATRALFLAAVQKLDGKGRVANGEAIMVHIVPGLTSPRWGGPLESMHTGLLLEDVQAANPEAQCATCCCFSPPQAEDRKKKSDSIQPSLQWPAVLGHEATPHARMGSGSSSSPCTPAPQRAVLVQVRYCCPRVGGEGMGGS